MVSHQLNAMLKKEELFIFIVSISKFIFTSLPSNGSCKRIVFTVFRTSFSCFKEMIVFLIGAKKTVVCYIESISFSEKHSLGAEAVVLCPFTSYPL